MAKERVTLGGRELVVITNGPVKHDFYMYELVRSSGLKDLHITGSADGFVAELIDRTIASGKALDLLAAMLIPATLDVCDWEPQTAEEIRTHLSRLTDPDDKQAIRSLLAEVLLGFFRSGLVSLTTSHTSSTTEEAEGESSSSEASVGA